MVFDYGEVHLQRLDEDQDGRQFIESTGVLDMMAGTAVMGKESETVGDSLDDFQTQQNQAQIDAFFADPRGPIATELLGNATSRIFYDETRFQRFAATIVRETHAGDVGDGEETTVQVRGNKHHETPRSKSRNQHPG